jgi:predicted RecA/RadA family phage recombinase
MATNFIQPGDSLDIPAPSGGVVSGTPYLIGGLFCVALSTAAVGIVSAFSTKGVWNLPKATGQAWTAGQRIYWDDTNKVCTTVATVGQLIGVSTGVAASGAAAAAVRLNGVAPATLEGPQTAITDLTLTLLAGTANDVSQAITDPADSPATADALRDDIVANALPAIRNNLADQGTKINAILAALRQAGILA